jgi:hypothetical protein
MVHRILALGMMLCLAKEVAHAQTQSSRRSAPLSTSSRTVSLRALLQLQGEQDEHLNLLYDEYAKRRVEQEVRFASRQQGDNSSIDERLRREQLQAQQRIAAELLSKRQQALQVLRPVQRSQLQAFSQDPRYNLRHDRYYQLLLLPVEALGQTPLDLQERSSNSAALYPSSPYRSGRSRTSGGYGVYGGYSYGGPSYGVYGNIGRGSVGVHAGIGNRGPSIGVGIGRVFGGVRF